MNSTRMIIDCDPGLDDALALLLAHADPSIVIEAVTTVGGNVALADTTRNALELREYLGFTAVPVAAGAAGPLAGATRNATKVHGAGGLGSVTLPAAILGLDERDAVTVIVDLLEANPGEIDLVAIGPLTNIALALRREPRIAQWAKSFVIMGGSFTRGNSTPAAEFNIYADPQAASEVFAAGWPVVMVGLDLTLQARVTGEIAARMRELGALGSELVVPLATFWADPLDPNWVGQAVHDVCAVAYVTHPEMFTSVAARVDVETAGEFTGGMTVTDFRSTTPNAIVPTRLDVDAFWDMVLRHYSVAAQAH